MCCYTYVITTRKFQSIYIKEVTDEGNSQNEIGHWANSGIRVAVQVGSECKLKSQPDSSVG